MAYTKTTWVNGTTPLNAQNMNKIEEGISANDSAIKELSGVVADPVTNWLYYTEEFDINSNTFRMAVFKKAANAEKKLFILDGATGDIYYESYMTMTMASMEIGPIPQPIWRLPVDTYDPEGTEAVTGKAVAAALDVIREEFEGKTGGSSAAVSTYDPNGTDPVNGKAVAEAVSGKLDASSEVIFAEKTIDADNMDSVTFYVDDVENGVYIKGPSSVWVDYGTVYTTDDYSSSFDWGSIDPNGVFLDFNAAIENYEGSNPGHSGRCKVDINFYNGSTDEDAVVTVYRKEKVSFNDFLPCKSVTSLPTPSADTMDQIYKYNGKYYTTRLVKTGLQVEDVFYRDDVLKSIHKNENSLLDATSDCREYDTFYRLFSATTEAGYGFTVYWHSQSFEDYPDSYSCGVYASSYDPYDGNGYAWGLGDFLQGKTSVDKILTAIGDENTDLQGEYFAIDDITELGAKVFGGPYYAWFNLLTGEEVTS